MGALVTVAIPSYNHVQYIEAAIDSVLAQTYESWELIIIDDGSQDGTPDLLRRLPQLDDARVRVILHEQNEGQARRLNEAVAVARGQFLSWLPSDDWYLQNKLQTQVDRFARLGREWGVVYANGYRYDEDTGETTEFRPARPRTGYVLRPYLDDPGMIYAITPMIRLECLRRYPFWEDFKVDGEAVLWRIAMRYKFDYVDEFVAVMRAHSYNAGSDLFRQHRDVPAILRRLVDHPDFPEEYRAEGEAIVSRYYRKFAWNSIRQHSNKEVAAACLREAIRADARGAALDFRSWLSLVMVLIPGRVARYVNAGITSCRARRRPALRDRQSPGSRRFFGF